MSQAWNLELGTWNARDARSFLFSLHTKRATLTIDAFLY